MMEWLNPVTPDASVWLGLEVVRATVVLLTAVGAAGALRRASAAARHLVWCAALVSLLVLPMLSRGLPWRWSPLPPALAVETSVVPTGATADVSNGGVAGPRFGADRVVPATGASDATRAQSTLLVRAWSAVTDHALAIVLGLWAAGALFSLGRLALGGLVLRRTVRRAGTLDDISWRRPLYEAADRLHLRAAPRLVVSDRMPMPFVTGLLRPTIVLPATAWEWSAERRRAVLLHELAHVRRRDLVLNVLAHVASSLWWFHPLARIAASRLRAESERACDDLVLRLGTLPSAYAQDLLHIVQDAGRVSTPSVALPMAQRREFEGRMLAILEADARRDPPRRRHALLAGAACALLIVPLAGLGPAPVVAGTAPPSAPQPERATLDDAPGPDAVDVSSGPDRMADASRSDARAPVEREEDEERSSPDAAHEAAPGVDFEDADAPDAVLPPLATQDTGVIAALRGALRDRSAEVRAEAAWALGSMHATVAAPDLAALLDSDDSPRARRMAVWSLAELNYVEAAGPIARAARSDADEEVREIAVWALGQFADPGSLSALVAALGDGSADVRSTAAWAIGTLAPDDAPAALIAALGDADGEVREHAAWAVGRTRDADAVSALTGMIGDQTAGEAAMWALMEIGGDAARPALLEALRSGSDDVRAAAARALAGRGSQPWPWPWPRPMTRD